MAPTVLVNIGSFNGLSPARWQAITWNTAGLLLIFVSLYKKNHLT